MEWKHNVTLTEYDTLLLSPKLVRVHSLNFEHLSYSFNDQWRSRYGSM